MDSPFSLATDADSVRCDDWLDPANVMRAPDAESAGSGGVGGVNRIIRCDCLDYMRTMTDGSIDAVVTDPPYCSGSVSEASRTASKGQGLRSENLKRLGWFVGDNMGTAGLVWLIRSVAVEALRLMKGSGSMLVFCDWRMVPNLIPAVESAGFRYQNLIVWDKKHMGLGNGFRARHELIMHMTCGSPEYHDKGTSNVIQCGRVSADDREHQTQKPADLIAQLVRVVCPPGGTVLDPFAGSCTLAEACLQTGRNYVCLERDPDHVATGESRIVQTQPDLGMVRLGGGGGVLVGDSNGESKSAAQGSSKQVHGTNQMPEQSKSGQ